MRFFDVTTSWITSVARVGSGLAVGALGPRPPKRLILYEFEACPFCRKVREALSMLDLEVEIRPCPKGGRRFRPEVEARGGKAMFPYLIDEAAGVEMYESDAIVAYLYTRYGAGPVPLLLRPPLGTIGSQLAGIARAGRGRTRRGSSGRPDRVTDAPLELWSFEASPYCRLVREVLCELELPYLLHKVAKGSPSRPAFVARSGRMRVPYLVDPVSGRGMFESAEIIAWLDATWGS